MAADNKDDPGPGSSKQTRKPRPTSTAPPRKRRRRTVVTGAPDDCFTCAKRGTQCDRRRPYCSQCLELGQECSGYKTTLTWGMGVASRGKLRGLSLPVKGSQSTGPKSKSQPGSDSKSYPQVDSDQSPQLTPTHRPAPETGSMNMPTYVAPNTYADPRASIPQPQQSGPGPPRSVPLMGNMQQQVSPSLSASSYDGTQLNSLTQEAHRHDSVSSGLGMFSSPEASTMASSPDQSNELLHPIPQNWSGLPQISMTESRSSSQIPQGTQYSQGHADEDKDDRHLDVEPRDPNELRMWMAGGSPSLSQLLLARSVGRTPRLKYLISYYVEVIAPVIVAFDSSTNPYRTQVLRLAQESESLQEAIAALSTSNLKRRQEGKTLSTERTLPSRMSSLAHRALTEDAYPDHEAPEVEELAREEHFHRGLAVRALNAELADPERRLSDSVLATLLVLCLFHICDTGVAQFKVQFAGIKRLLAIRMRHAGTISDAMRWFIRSFTWFDTMTATTNDRESQLGGTCLDITTFSDEEWGLENLTGCDSSLFKNVAQLGRLNSLSQNQAVSPMPPDLLTASTTLPPSMLPYPLDPVYPSGIPTSAPMNAYGFPLPVSQPSQTIQPTSPAFWAEWFSLRQKLESWRLPPRNEGPLSYVQSSSSPSASEPSMPPPSSPNLQMIAPQNVPDVFNISESFRHSAILYSERLAYPDLPSSHPRIQNIVQIALRHITAVQSDVYLLWPLFITGSECVLEDHRMLIRQRCTAISKDSGFFNNLSCLELLEKVWAQNSDTARAGPDVISASATQPALGDAMAGYQSGMTSWDSAVAPLEHGFRWNTIMQAKRGDGEYMIV